MSKIEFSMDNVSQVAVSPINADSTPKQGTGSNQLVFGGVIVSQKGKPFEVIPVTAANFLDKLGKPYHSSLGKLADGMRVLDEALRGGNGLVVRVVPKTATYPAIKLTKPADEVTITNEAINYSADLSLEDGEFLAIAIKDGAQSDNRSITLAKADEATYGAGMFTLTLEEEQAAGGSVVLEEWVVSLEPTAVDQMGSAAFIETVLEERSQYLTCRIDAEVAKREVTAIAKTKFTGATNGNISDITADDYQKAVKALRTTVYSFNYVCGLGCYDTAVITGLAQICKDKRISGYFDVDPRLTHEAALEFKKGLNFNNHRASFVHIPYQAKCRFYGNMAVWGGSGIGFAAKALGVAKISPVGGWHYTPAGVERAVIQRTGLKPIQGAGEPNYQEMYKARLNKLGTDENGNLFIDDSLTSYNAENYLRFEQVASIADAISRDFYALGNRLKHQPDGATLEGLTDGMASILEGYEAVGALVTPRNPAQDGENAWTLEVKQVEIDYWKVTWSFCPTGSARRILGEPVLIR